MIVYLVPTKDGRQALIVGLEDTSLDGDRLLARLPLDDLGLAGVELQVLSPQRTARFAAYVETQRGKPGTRSPEPESETAG